MIKGIIAYVGMFFSILRRGRSAFSVADACSILSFLMGEDCVPSSMSRTECFAAWYCANGLAVTAERCVRRESNALPEGISHHAALMLFRMFLTFFRNADVKNTVLMFDQSQAAISHNEPVKVDWAFIEGKSGVLFSRLSRTFVSSLSCYGDNDARVYRKTLEILKSDPEFGANANWVGSGAQIVLDMELEKVRSRFLRSLRQFILQMSEYTARFGDCAAVRKWAEAGAALTELRGVHVSPENDPEIIARAHQVCDLMNEALVTTYTLRMTEKYVSRFLPPRSPQVALQLSEMALLPEGFAPIPLAESEEPISLPPPKPTKKRGKSAASDTEKDDIPEDVFVKSDFRFDFSKDFTTIRDNEHKPPYYKITPYVGLTSPVAQKCIKALLKGARSKKEEGWVKSPDRNKENWSGAFPATNAALHRFKHEQIQVGDTSNDRVGYWRFYPNDLFDDLSPKGRNYKRRK